MVQVRPFVEVPLIAAREEALFLLSLIHIFSGECSNSRCPAFRVIFTARIFFSTYCDTPCITTVSYTHLEDCFGSRGELYFWPKEYSSAKMAQKRIDKLEEAGIRCELTGYNGGYIRLLGYTPKMRDSLERERQEYAAAYQAWYSKQNLKTI